MKKGYIQIYTGNGKGKTTAAMGLALRACGHGFTVKIVQFLKGGVSGELTSIKKLEGIDIYRVTDADKYIWDLTAEQKMNMQVRSAAMLEEVRIWFEEEIDIIILDEIMAAIEHDIVSLNDVISLLKAKPDCTEVVMTGRNAPNELIEMAHLVSEINDVKHYYSDDVPARKGIEF